MNIQTQQVTTKGDCFQANFDWLLAYPGSNDHRIRLCHGMVFGEKDSPVAGQTFVHCWIELNDHVLDFSNGRAIAVPKEVLARKGRILEETVCRYTFNEAVRLCIKHEHYGPWDDRLMEGAP